jgi:hypothetical protein
MVKQVPSPSENVNAPADCDSDQSNSPADIVLAQMRGRLLDDLDMQQGPSEDEESPGEEGYVSLSSISRYDVCLDAVDHYLPNSSHSYRRSEREGGRDRRGYHKEENLEDAVAAASESDKKSQERHFADGSNLASMNAGGLMLGFTSGADSDIEFYSYSDMLQSGARRPGPAGFSEDEDMQRLIQPIVNRQQREEEAEMLSQALKNKMTALGEQVATARKAHDLRMRSTSNTALLTPATPTVTPQGMGTALFLTSSSRRTRCPWLATAAQHACS